MLFRSTSRRELDSLAKNRGRNPNDISITIYGQPPDSNAAQDYLNAGANRVVVRPEFKETEDEMALELERIAEEVL